MESGEAEFGDADAALKLIDQIKNGTILGKVLACGASTTGKVLGVSHIPAVNGQAMPAYDPRAIKGMGVTFATTPMGADHTYGPVVKTDKSWIEASKEAQLLMAMIDSLGFCMFIRGAITKDLQVLVDLVNGRFGWDLNMEWLENMAKETIRDEYKFNELAGFTKENYRMPETFIKNKIASLNLVFDVDIDELDKLRGCYD